MNTKIEKIKGVNLGNWLVLEKWMSPKLFEGTTAEDEYHLPTQLSKEVYEARIRQHRSEYICERDFVYIKSLGLNSVRIPVPYFIFGDREPFIGCIEELDKAFGWAKRYGLSVLIDLHTAPYSQNGFDNGGICGVCKWAQKPEEVEFVLDVLEKLAKRYGHHEALLGIQTLNEPVSDELWEHVKTRYQPVDPKMAEGSMPPTLEFIKEFNLKAYDRMRPHLASGAYIVIHDAFRLLEWKEFMREDKYRNVILDTHQYLMMAEMRGAEQTVEGYVKFIEENYEKEIQTMQEYFPVICGEWCLFNSLACGRDTKGGQSVLNGEMNAIQRTFTDEEKKEIYRSLCRAQIKAWNKGSGYYYWSYKLLIDTVHEESWVGWDAWDLGRCASFGWFEDKER